MNEKDEKIYMSGEGEALKSIILYCQAKLKGLGFDLKTNQQFSVEREQTIKTLRTLCDEYGDNEWSDNLHLSDIIQKHLGIQS